MVWFSTTPPATWICRKYSGYSSAAGEFRNMVTGMCARQTKSATSLGRARPPSSMVMNATFWSVGRRCQNGAAPVAGSGSGTGCGGGAAGKVGTCERYQSRLPGAGFAVGDGEVDGTNGEADGAGWYAV